MANSRSFSVSSMIAFLSQAATEARRILAVVTTLIFVAACLAQDQSHPPSPPNSKAELQASLPPGPTTETIPAGTRLALVLTHPIFSNTTHRGDEIHAQITAPTILENHVAIPGGVFLQGKVDKLMRHGTRGELLMQCGGVDFSRWICDQHRWPPQH